MNEPVFAVYILASKAYGTLYIGHTDNLLARILTHKQGTLAGFTKKYHVTRLVYFEHYPTRESAFQRERQLKKFSRAAKIILIETGNPHWADLASSWQL
jgi:putative endonuclease